jgi:hypothetical protein
MSCPPRLSSWVLCVSVALLTAPLSATSGSPFRQQVGRAGHSFTKS